MVTPVDCVRCRWRHFGVGTGSARAFWYDVTMGLRSARNWAASGSNPAQEPRLGTYQTRVVDYSSMNRAAGDAALDAYAELYGRVEHKLFADVAADRSATSLKSAYLERYGIPARMFNAVRVSLDGKVASVREQQKLRLDDLQRRIARAERQVSDAAERGRQGQVHQKKRRLANLRHRLSALETDIAAGRVRLCFGSKRLWRKQHHLEANGYASHQEWLRDWREARSNEFFVLGSRDETAGCQLCVATVADDGTLTLRLRMPDYLTNQYGKYLTIEGVRFAYGHEQVLAALQSNAEYTAYRREHGEKAARATDLGQAISYRFKRDDKGWRVFASTDMMDVPVVTDRRRGVIGVDLNADHLAVAETDASGNCLNAWRVPLITYGKSQRQAEAIIGDAVARVVDYAKEAGKPVVIEKLDFRRKKAALEGESPPIQPDAVQLQLRQGQGVLPVPRLPRRSGSTSGEPGLQFRHWPGQIHGALRAQRSPGSGLGAGPTFARLFRAHPKSTGLSLVGNGVQVAFTVPARKRVKHVWTYWGAISGTAETGACSAAPAGEAETPTQSGSGCPAW